MLYTTASKHLQKLSNWPQCTQRRKIITVPLNILSSVYIGINISQTNLLVTIDFKKKKNGQKGKQKVSAANKLTWLLEMASNSISVYKVLLTLN